MINSTKRLIPLALGTFGLGMSEFVMMGILPDIANSMNVSIPTAGHFISIYAIGVIFGAISMAFLSKNQPLNKLLLGLIAVYTVGNLLTALAFNYSTMNIARFIAGIPHGSFFGIGVVAIKQMAEKGHDGRDVAFMVAGMTIANLIGIPLATFLSHLTSWRIIYLFVGVLGLAVFGAIIKWLPAFEPMPYTDFRGQFKFLKSLTPWLLLVAITMGNSALFCELSYINPLLTKVSSFAPKYMSALMFVSGLGMYFGNLCAGKLSDKYTPARVSEYTQLLSFFALLGLFFFAKVQIVAVILVFVCSFCLFALSAPQQILIVEVSKGGEVLGSSLAPLAFTLGNAIGAIAGGLPIEHGLGYEYAPLAGVGFAFVGFVLLNKFRKRITGSSPRSVCAGECS